jgi:putative phosphoesterase
MALRIGLIADTHIPEARESLWPQVYEAFDGVDYIFHAGDIHELYVLDALEEVAPVHAARGNGEDGSGGRPVQPEDPYAWDLELEGVHVGLTHYVPAKREHPPELTVARWVERFFPEKTPDVIVYGDTHSELINEVDGILCVNPGSPTYPNQYKLQYGTIGFLELEAGEARPSIWLITDDGIEPFDWDAPPPWRVD